MQIFYLVFTSIVFSIDLTVSVDEYFNYSKNETNRMDYSDFFNRFRRTVVQLNKKKLWKDAVIPYDFDFVVTGEQRRLIKIAMREWGNSTCLQFVSRSKKLHNKYLYFSKHPSCECCYIEGNNYRQNKWISFNNACYHKHILLHELGHAIGFYHEHNHPDRDQYININFSMIEPQDKSQYQKYLPTQVDTLGLPYDRKSIMHYPSYILTEKTFKNMSVSVPVSQASVFNEYLGKAMIQNNSLLSDGDIAATNLMYQCPGCGKTFYDPAGAFGYSSSNSLIPDFERCEWRIRGAEGERIKLTIIISRIHQTYNCLLDYVEVRDGNAPSNPFIDRYCSRRKKTKIYPTNNLLVVYVKMSHPNITGAFEAEYETICNQFIELESGMVYNLESPNYPENYKPNKNCNWYFLAPENHQINIKFDLFEIESGQNCENDYVSIVESDDEQLKQIGVYCGVKNAWQVNSTERKVYVKFFSNESKQEKGFAATISSIMI